MQGDPKIIHHLQAQLRNGLTATHQYFLHYQLLTHWRFGRLAGRESAEAIGQLKHADALMARILVLDGLPNLQDLGKLLIGEDVAGILDGDLRMERAAQLTVKEGIVHCEAGRDFVSRQLLLDILRDTENHIAFLEGQLDLISRVGPQNYLQSIRQEAPPAAGQPTRGNPSLDAAPLMPP